MAATDRPCSVADGGAKRLSDFVVDPDSSLRLGGSLTLPGFPLLPRTPPFASPAGRLRYAANANAPYNGNPALYPHHVADPHH